MSLIADVLKKAQASKLARRYRSTEPTGSSPVVLRRKESGTHPGVSSIVKAGNLSTTLWIGLTSAIILFLFLFVYFFYGPGQRVRLSSSPSFLAEDKPSIGLILTPPPSIPTLESLTVAGGSGSVENSPGGESPMVSHAELVALNGRENGSKGRAKEKKTQGENANSDVNVTSSLLEEVRYRFNLALLYQENNHFSQARREYEKVIRIWPLHAEAYNNLGVVYKELGNHGQAIAHFERALALNPSYVRAYHNLGVIYHLKGDQKRAKKNYQAALALDGNHLSSLNNLGLVYREEQRLHEAREVLEKALKLKLDFPQTRYNLALVLEELGEYQLARNHYQKFVALTGEKNRTLADKVKDHLRELPEQKN